jgi:hypothetical protein
MTTQPPYGSSETSRPPSDEELRKLAIRRLKQKQAFRGQLFTFVVINAMLWIIWLVTASRAHGGSWFPWPIFPTLGWGLGLAFQWHAAYGPGSRAISESDVNAEIRRLRGE